MYEIREGHCRYAWPVPESPTLQAVVFDFDGTLVDSEPIHGLATREGLALAGIDLSVEEFLARWVGLPDMDCYVQVARDRGVELDAGTLERVRLAKNEVYEGLVLDGQVPLCAGVVTIVKAIAGRIAMGVCSAARRVEIEAALGRHGLAADFRTIVAMEDVRRGKPDPEGYRLSVERLGVDPSGCVAIEDTPRGIEAALGAGLAVVGVAQTVASSRLRGATVVHKSMRDVNEAVLQGAIQRHAAGLRPA